MQEPSLRYFSGWHVQGKEKIDKKSIYANETSHPILLIGNTLARGNSISEQDAPSFR